MALMAESLPANEVIHNGLEPAMQVKPVDEVHKDDLDSGYEDCREYDEDNDDERVGSDIESLASHKALPQKLLAAPDLPQRNNKRVSKPLDSVMLDLQALGVKGQAQDDVSIREGSDPHELYLSSEEDGSISDDYEDYLSDLEGTSSEGAVTTRPASSRASSRKSQEVTAVAVSFQIVGKPQIIEIPISQHNSPKSTRSTLSMSLDSLTKVDTPAVLPKRSLLRRPAPLNLRDSALRDSRRMSVSSILSSSSHSSRPSASTFVPTSSSYIASNAISATINSVASLPPRKGSRLASLTTLVTQTKTSLQSKTEAAHSFLTSDPFASRPQTASAQDADVPPAIPKTPTSAAATAFRRGFQKTLLKARKTSMPKISLAYTAGVVPPRTDSISGGQDDILCIDSSEDKTSEQEVIVVEREDQSSAAPSPRAASVAPAEVTHTVAQALPQVPIIPAARERKSSLIAFGRSKSIKAR